MEQLRDNYFVVINMEGEVQYTSEDYFECDKLRRKLETVHKRIFFINGDDDILQKQ